MNYFYEAVDNAGQIVLGKLDGVDEAEVQQKLLNLGYHARSIAQAPEIRTAMPVEAQVTRVMAAGAAGAAPSEQTISVDAAPSMPLQAVQAAPNAAASLNATMQSIVLPQSAPPVQSRSRVSITLAGNAARQRTHAAPVRSVAPAQANAAQSELGGVSTRDLMIFFQQLASLVRSGMSIYSALESLGPRTPNANLSRTAREMMEQARAGGAISNVMQRYPGIYPDHIVGMVRAGELGGFLEIALGEIADGYGRNIALYRGSWLPKHLALEGLFTLALGQPIFPYLFPDGNIHAFVLAEVRNILLAGLVMGAVKIGSVWINLPKNRQLRDRWALKLPPFGDLQRQAALATFARTLKRLFNAGIAPSSAWECAMQTASNVEIRDRLQGAQLMMQEGRSLADAFSATGLFPNMVEQLIMTGTQSGEVVESLERVETFYQSTVEESSVKARNTMFRMGILAALVLGGATACWAAHNYFNGLFHWVDTYFAD
jgi:type IV pilus assembly protein PilC